jgi:hypothetical protein
MEISNFKMTVTPEQSKIVQEFLFKNGYGWISGGREAKYTDKPVLCFDKLLVWSESIDTVGEYDEITFEQFKELYMKEALTTQVGGSHYQKYAIQPIEFIVKNNIPFLEANVIKYIVRYKDKNGIEDLKKAKHYLEMLIENYESNK